MTVKTDNGGNFYAWLRGVRSGGGHDAVALDASPVIPLWKCTAQGGPQNCRYHRRFLNGASGQFVDPPPNPHSGDYSDEFVEISPDYGIETWLDDSVDEIIETPGRDMFDDQHRALLSEMTDAIRRGALAPARMPATSMKRGRIDGIPNWLLDVYNVLSTATGDYDGMSVDDSSADENNAGEDGMLRDFAQKAGLWIPNVKKAVKTELVNRHKIGGGQESAVYDADDSVVKVMDISAFRKSPRRAIESIMLFNHYFPESANEVLGIGENEFGNTCFVLGQRRLKLSRKRVSDAEKEAFMRDRGFYPHPRSNYDGELDAFRSEDGAVAVYDLHRGNIKKTVDGEIVVVDAYPELDTPACGGFYDLEHKPKDLFANKEMKRIQKEYKKMRKANPLTQDEEAPNGPRLVIRHPTNPLPLNPYYDPERIARIESGPRPSFEELKAIADEDAAAHYHDHMYIRGRRIADLAVETPFERELRERRRAHPPTGRELAMEFLTRSRAARAEKARKRK